MMVALEYGSSFAFQIGTPTTIGRFALDSLPGLCADLETRHPFWIFPDEIVQQRTAKRIISKVYGKRIIDWDTMSTVIQPSLDEKALAKIGQTVREHGHDCLILFGDSDTINRGKLIKSEIEVKPSAAQLETIIVPCGETDCSEYLGNFPSYSIGDGRLTRATTPKNVARTVCSALMHLGTSLLTNESPMMLAIAESGLQYAHQTLEHLLEPGLTGQRWIDCTLFAIATSHAAGICAQNRGESTIINFCERLAVPGLADHYQTTAAVLPYVLKLIHRSKPSLYTNMMRLLQGMDPMEFGKAWLSLTEPKGTDQILHQLCKDLNDLLIDQDHVEELIPLLALFPMERRSQ